MSLEDSETRFEQDIETSLLNQGYRKILPTEYDLEKNLFFNVLLEFIKSSQPKEWAKYERTYGSASKEKLYRRLNNEIINRGVLDVLKKGIKDLGIEFKLCYFKPNNDLNEKLNELYSKNILGVTRQFRYSLLNSNEVDMVISINGIPIFAIELKDNLKGQTYENAIKQWVDDRDSKEVAFRFNSRILAFFAADLYDVYMSTKIDGYDDFMPFNQGSNGAGNPGSRGNPANLSGYTTSYFWERVLTKKSVLDLINKFITVSTVKKEVITPRGEKKTITSQKIIFPRFHQYDAVHKIADDVKKHGSGVNYLINHSAGSGKSNSIAWLAYRLASLFDDNEKPIFDTVIVVTNRTVLDNQLQETIESFDHTAGLVVSIKKSSGSNGLKKAINDRKKIIISTIQKFLFAYKDFDSMRNRNFAIIIDEAHQGQSGESAKTLKKSLIDKEKELEKYRNEEGLMNDEIDDDDKMLDEILAQGHHDNQSFFAFTATPNSKSLELFGTISTDEKFVHELPTFDKNGVKKIPFHTYSMRQAIDEGFILDVLANYVTIRQAFRLAKVGDDNPELVEDKTKKALYAYYKSHERTISDKVTVIMENFLSNGRHKINDHGKAMVVTSSRHNAVRYYYAIQNYIKTHKDQCGDMGILVAFSGEVKFDNDPNTYTEANMNIDKEGKPINTDEKFRKAFSTDDFKIMVVANKYQTGYDEPLLHSMYVDKKLLDINAVQTLSRLNRTCKDKYDTFVLDFENTEEDIKKAFQKYYENVELVGTTDVNYVYDLLSKVKSYSLFSDNDVDEFNTIMDEAKDGKKQDEKTLGKITSLLKPITEKYSELDFETRTKFRDTLLKFNRAYGFVTQLVRIADKDLFKDYLFTSQLFRLLPKSKVDVIDITDKIRLEYVNLKETFRGSITLEKKSGEVAPTSFKPNKERAKKMDTLERIVSKMNELYGANFSESDKVALDSVYKMMMDDKDVLNNLKKYATDNNPEMFIKSIFPEKFKEILVACYLSQDQAYDKLLNNNEFQNTVMDIMAKEFYKILKKEGKDKND